MQVVLGRTVFVAHTETQCEAARSLPLVLKKAAEISRTNVARRGRILNVFIGQAKYEVCPVVLRIATGSNAAHVRKVKLAVDIEVVNGVVLIWSERGAGLERVRAFDPCDRVVPGKCIVD